MDWMTTKLSPTLAVYPGNIADGVYGATETADYISILYLCVYLNRLLPGRGASRPVIG